MNRRMSIVLILTLILNHNIHATDKTIRMSVDDTFVLKAPENYELTVQKELPLRFANVAIKSKTGYDFNMMLYFKCDTPDLSICDAPQKMKHIIKNSSTRYLPYCVENEIKLQDFDCKRFGYFTRLTDKKLADKSDIPNGEYLYMTRGLFRVSKDSTLGFSLMTNDIDTAGYNKVIEYVLSYEK